MGQAVRPLGAIEIAGIVFGLHANWPKPLLWIKEGYPPFLSRRRPTFNVSIQYQEKWPKGLPMRLRDEPTVLWKEKRFFIQTPYYRAQGNLVQRKVDASMAPGFSSSGFIRTLLALLLLREGGFLLHAAGLVKGKRAFVFSGPTGSGKTTIATKLANGHTVLNDETLAIRPTRLGYFAYSTPFPGDMNKVFVNEGAKMKALYFLQRGEAFSRRRLSQGEAMTWAFPQLICLERNREGVESAFAALTQFSQRVPCFEFSFQPTLEMWRHLS